MSCQGDEEDVFSRHVLTCSVIDAEETGSDGVKQDAGCWRMRRIAHGKDSQTRDIWNFVDKSTKFQFFIAFYYSLG